MKPHHKILLIWTAYIGFYVLAALLAAPDKASFSDGVTSAASALLGIISFYLFREEEGRSNRALFLNFGLFFGFNGVQRPL